VPFDGVSPDDPRHEPSPHGLYPAEKATKARQISLKMLAVPLCTGGKIILTLLELTRTYTGLLTCNSKKVVSTLPLKYNIFWSRLRINI